MWDCESGECVQTLHGHAGRLARIGFHPTGRYLGTASFDHTWRLWDVETGDELLLQARERARAYGSRVRGFHMNRDFGLPAEGTPSMVLSRGFGVTDVFFSSFLDPVPNGVVTHPRTFCVY